MSPLLYVCTPSPDVLLLPDLPLLIPDAQVTGEWLPSPLPCPFSAMIWRMAASGFKQLLLRHSQLWLQKSFAKPHGMTARTNKCGKARRIETMNATKKTNNAVRLNQNHGISAGSQLRPYDGPAFTHHHTNGTATRTAGGKSSCRRSCKYPGPSPATCTPLFVEGQQHPSMRSWLRLASDKEERLSIPDFMVGERSKEDGDRLSLDNPMPFFLEGDIGTWCKSGPSPDIYASSIQQWPPLWET